MQVCRFYIKSKNLRKKFLLLKLKIIHWKMNSWLWALNKCLEKWILQERVLNLGCFWIKCFKCSPNLPKRKKMDRYLDNKMLMNFFSCFWHLLVQWWKTKMEKISFKIYLILNWKFNFKIQKMKMKKVMLEKNQTINCLVSLTIRWTQ